MNITHTNLFIKVFNDSLNNGGDDKGIKQISTGINSNSSIFIKTKYGKELTKSVEEELSLLKFIKQLNTYDDIDEIFKDMFFFVDGDDDNNNDDGNDEYFVNNTDNNDDMRINLKIPSQARKKSLKFCIPTYKIDQSFISGAFFDQYYLPHLTFVSDIFSDCSIINSSKVSKKLLVTDYNKLDYFQENNNHEIIWNEENGIEETLDPFNQFYRGLNINQKKMKIEQENEYFDLIRKSKILGDIICKALKEKNNLDLLPSSYKSLLRNKNEYEKMFQSKFIKNNNNVNNNNQQNYGEDYLTSNLTFSSDLRLKELLQSSEFNFGRGIIISIFIENVILSSLLLRRQVILSPSLSLLIYGDPSCGKSHLCEVSSECVIADLVEYKSQSSNLGNTSFKTGRNTIFNDDCPTHALPHDTPQTGKLFSEKKQYLENMNGINTYSTIIINDKTKRKLNVSYKFEVTTAYVSLTNNDYVKLHIPENLDPISQAISDRQIKISLFKPSQDQTILMKNILSKMEETTNEYQNINGYCCDNDDNNNNNNNNNNNKEQSNVQIFSNFDLYKSKSIIRSACIYIYFSKVSQNTLIDIDMNVFDFLSKTIENSIHSFFPNVLNERKIKRIESFCRVTVIKEAFEIVFRHLRNEVKSIDEVVNLMEYFVFCNTETVLWSFFFVVNELLNLPVTKFLKDCQETSNINFYRYDKHIFEEINLLNDSEDSEKLNDFLTEFVFDDERIIYLSEPMDEKKKDAVTELASLLESHYKKKQKPVHLNVYSEFYDNYDDNDNNKYNDNKKRNYDLFKNMNKRINESKAISLKRQISYCRMNRDCVEKNGNDKDVGKFIKFKCLNIDLSELNIARFKIEEMENDEVYLNLNYIEFRLDELKRIGNGILQDVVNLRGKTQVINFIPLVPISTKFEWIQKNKKFLYSLIHNPKYLSQFPTVEVPICITKEANSNSQYLSNSITKFYVLLQYINLDIKNFASIICDSVSYHSTVENEIVTPLKTNNEKEKDFIQIKLRKKKGKILSRNLNQKIINEEYGRENENEIYNRNKKCYMKFFPPYFKNSNIDQEGKKNFYHNNFEIDRKKYENIDKLINRSKKNSTHFLESISETSLLTPENVTDHISKKIDDNVSIKNKIMMLKKKKIIINNNDDNDDDDDDDCDDELKQLESSSKSETSSYESDSIEIPHYSSCVGEKLLNENYFNSEKDFLKRKLDDKIKKENNNKEKKKRRLLHKIVET